MHEFGTRQSPSWVWDEIEYSDQFWLDAVTMLLDVTCSSFCSAQEGPDMILHANIWLVA